MARVAGWPLFLFALLVGSPARADLCLYDAMQDGTGANVRWATPPIGYHVNVSRLPAAQQAGALAAVQAAFATWELGCTSLKFQYLGASASTTEVPGAILVYFGNDAASWAHGASAYFYSLGWQSPTGAISTASIGMNARDYLWSVGAAAMSIDIQSLVTQVMPGVLGFYVGSDPQSGSVSIAFNALNRTLTQAHLDGARYLYFQAGAGCVQPAKPTPCATWTPPGDGGPPKLDAAPDAAKDAGAPDLKKDGGSSDGKEDGAAAADGKKDGTPSSDGKKDSASLADAGQDGAPASDGKSDGKKDGASAGGDATVRLDRAGPDLAGWPLGSDGVRPAPPLGDDGCACALGAKPASPLSVALILCALLALRRRRP
jgi:MYXO-CTERM domain-containing protein